MNLCRSAIFSVELLLPGYSNVSLGQLYAVTNCHFLEAEPHWQLLGDESKERTVPSVPIPAIRLSPERPVSQN